MNSYTDKTNETLEMIAKSALNDISNRQDLRTKTNWLTGSRHGQKCKNKNKNPLKFPSIGAGQKNSKQNSFKNTPLLIRKRNQIYREKMSQILNVKENEQPQHLPKYYINEQLAQQISAINKQSSPNISALSKRSKKDSSSISKRYHTQQQQSLQDNREPQFSKQVIRPQFPQMTSDSSAQQIKRTFSLRVKKALNDMNKLVYQNNSKEIDEIKLMIADKRIKCRKLSKQGYLILKKDSLDAFQENCPPYVQSMELKARNLERARLSRQSRENMLSRTTISHHEVLDGNQSEQQTILKEISVQKHFLRNALQILHIRHLPNSRQKTS